MYSEYKYTYLIYKYLHSLYKYIYSALNIFSIKYMHSEYKYTYSALSIKIPSVYLAFITKMTIARQLRLANFVQ